MIRACFHKLQQTNGYPKIPPYDPPEFFPELTTISDKVSHLNPDNQIYGAVRSLLVSLDLDTKNYGTVRWNPFKKFVNEGETVLIKPNLVTHSHPQSVTDSIFWTISHPSIIRALIDYARLAVGLTGRIIIGDTPIENCDFNILCQISGLRKMVAHLRERGYEKLELLDFRTFQTTQYPDSTVVKTVLPGDPRGYTDIDLCRLSLFQVLEDKYGEQNYYTLGDHSVDHINPKTRKPGMPNRYHFSGTHIYRIPNTVLQSDFIINVAKLKTHKFSGVTLCLKNAIGICEGKEFLPHRRPGTPSEGGDSFPTYPSKKYVGWLRLKRAIYTVMGGKNADRFISLVRRIFPAKLPHEVNIEPLYGDWHGNDTIWRTTLDLNLILMHANLKGLDLSQRKRTYLGVVDGIIGMDHEAPMTGLPVYSNLLIVGLDPVAIDTLGTYLMGFDPRKIPTIVGAKSMQCRFLGNIRLERKQIKGNVSLEEARCNFVPTKGWMEFLKEAPSNWPF